MTVRSWTATGGIWDKEKLKLIIINSIYKREWLNDWEEELRGKIRVSKDEQKARKKTRAK